MNIKQERDEIIKHVDGLARMARVYRGRNVHYISQIADLELRALKTEAEFTNPQWISVKDQFPPEDADVLIHITSEWRAKITVAKLINCGHGFQWVTAGGNYYHTAEFSNITHWMPLPEAPEVEAR